MTPMKRLCDEPLSPEAARILRSAEGDAPASAAASEARILEAYGVSAPVPMISGPALDPTRRKRWVLLGGAVVVVAGALAGWKSTHRGGAAKPTTAITEPALAMTSPAPQAPLTPRAAEPTVRVEDLPAAVDTVAPANRPVAIEPVASELAAIDAARAALRVGHADDALARIAQCRRTFPKPLYAEEADALEVQALAAAGRGDEARAKADLFFRAHPDSPYDQRIRAAIGARQ